MKIKTICILTDKTSCFAPYANILVNQLKSLGYCVGIYYNHHKINQRFDIVFFISYFKIVEQSFLERNKYNLVIHESALPHGRGWSPLSRQVLEGKNKIPVVMFHANKLCDEGDIVLKDFIQLDGTELHDEIRIIQSETAMRLCHKFLKLESKLKPMKQRGTPTYYPKRKPKDNELNINKSIKEQFGLFRIADNTKYPVFFMYKKTKYILSIKKKNINNSFI